ncbi:MAG TPA: class II aldolase/adducin family protein [Bryobacteraceae bacterium]|nr:class II aldolase/adducin family protein [Bryobacteraceae bacterium]
MDSLLEVSARVGSDPLLVQAATGNTSIKLDGVLWIKASGKWLAHANTEDILIPVNLAETRRRIEQNADPAGQSAIVNGKTLGTSVETAMHAVLPHRVVLHVHSVDTIAWAVRRDGASQLASRLEGIDWQWIPYVPSGLPLARAVEAALARAPGANVLVLANHGLVIGAEDCRAAEALLREVERRVAIPPRLAPEPQWAILEGLVGQDGWSVPSCSALHAIGTDPVSSRIVQDGVLYPCQAIFLTSRALAFPQNTDVRKLVGLNEPFVIIEGAGLLTRKRPSFSESATLAGLAQVLQRIPHDAPLQYLTETEVRDLLCADVYHYRDVVEDNSGVLLKSDPADRVTRL